MDHHADAHPGDEWTAGLTYEQLTPDANRRGQNASSTTRWAAPSAGARTHDCKHRQEVVAEKGTSPVHGLGFRLKMRSRSKHRSSTPS